MIDLLAKKFKEPICHLKNLNNLIVINAKRKWFMDAFHKKIPCVGKNEI
jgi:hypothetical protein